jgi:TolA-binding protein
MRLTVAIGRGTRPSRPTGKAVGAPPSREGSLRSLVPVSVACMLALSLSGGCLTSGDGEEIRAKARDSDRRIVQLEQMSEQSRRDMDAKLAELQQVLDKATAVLTRGSADVGAQVEQMREQLNGIEGTVAEVRNKIETLEQQMATMRTDFDTRAPIKGGAVDPSQIPADKVSHFQAAYTAYTAGDQERARSLFREYVTRYHDDAKAGEAQYWIAASYTQQNKPATALGEYRKVIAEFSKSGAVNVALYGMADAFYRLKACTDAKSAIEALIKRKPDASLLDRAKRLQKEIKAAGKAYCTS